MSNKLRFNLFDRVKTADPKASVFGLGVTIERPEDERGDSVNQIMIGGRFDAVTEWADARRAKSQETEAKAEADNVTPITNAVSA